MRRIAILCVCWVLVGLMPAMAHDLEQGAMTVKVCDDEALWPPYVFTLDKEGNSPVQGAMIEVLDEISKITGITFDLSLISWKRCLDEVKNYHTSGQFEMFINGSFNEQRVKDYWATSPVYFTTVGYWYSKKTFPDGPQIRGLADLKKYSALGVSGYSYKDYGYGPQDEFDGVGGIDKGAKDFADAFRKLDLGRGEIILQSAPVPFGFKYLGKDIIPADVVFHKVPGERGTGFYIYISKGSHRGLELLARINQAIVILDNHGVLDDIMKKYLVCGRYC